MQSHRTSTQTPLLLFGDSTQRPLAPTRPACQPHKRPAGYPQLPHQPLWARNDATSRPRPELPLGSRPPPSSPSHGRRPRPPPSTPTSSPRSSLCVTASLSALTLAQVDYPLLDVTLILTIISDYVAEDSLHANEGLIREQLGALEAQVVADAADAAESEPAVSERAPTLAAPLDSHSVGPSRPSSAFATASASGSTALTSVCDEPLDEETGPQSEAELLALFFPNLCA